MARGPKKAANPVTDGDRREALEALRREMAGRLPEAADREAIGLTTQLRLILAELAQLSTGEEADVVDQLAQRRAARRADTADPRRSDSAE